MCKIQLTETISKFRSASFAALALVLVAGPVAADSDSGDAARERQCRLLSMLNPGGNLPPHCRDAGHGDEIPEEVARQLDQLQLAVLPFFSFDVAVAAGWDVAISPCVEHPELGGMGFHIANTEQLQNGHLNLLRPEVLLYAPLEDGSMEFLGVEYIIPGALWQEADAPEFLGQHLHYNPMQDIWALHVWVGKHNPDGIFDDWNPEVSCQFAD